MKNTTLRKIIKGISHNLFETLTDLTLFSIFLTGGLLGIRSRRDLWSSLEDATKLLEKLNYQTFLVALNRLKQKQLIKEESEIGEKRLELTENGREYVKRALPIYRLNRAWEGKIYLVTYDIPENRRGVRDLLRNKLRRTLSAGFLQRSVFLTPYNPHRSLQEFAEKYHLQGTILISELDKNGTIGNLTLPQTINKLYRLENLSKDYERFIEKWRKISHGWNRFNLCFEFCSILKEDPQLPFELLPPNFPSTQAYNLFLKLLETKAL